MVTETTVAVRYRAVCVITSSAEVVGVTLKINNSAVISGILHTAYTIELVFIVFVFKSYIGMVTVITVLLSVKKKKKGKKKSFTMYES